MVYDKKCRKSHLVPALIQFCLISENVNYDCGHQHEIKGNEKKGTFFNEGKVSVWSPLCTLHKNVIA